MEVVPANGESKGREFQRVIRASVRGCCNTWSCHVQAGEVTPEALELLVDQAAVSILSLLADRPLEVALGLLPGLVRVMLLVFLEVVTELGNELDSSP